MQSKNVRSGRRGEDGGFTLLEVVIAIAILGIIVVPLTTSLIRAMRETHDVAKRLGQSSDAQRIADAWSQDVQSLDTGGPDVHGECYGTRNGLSTGTVLITFNSDVNSVPPGGGPALPMRTVSWAVTGSDQKMTLWRRICEGASPVKEEMLARNIGKIGSGTNHLSVVHGPDDLNPTGPPNSIFCDGDSCKIVLDGDFKYSLEVARRDPGVVVQVEKPPAVPCLSATPGNQKVTANWAIPNTTVPIIGFHIEAWSDNAGTIATSNEVGPTSTSIEITGLSNSFSPGYYIAIYAYNINGFSPTGTLCGPVRPSPTVPGIPETVTAIPGPISSPKRVDVTWAAPLENGGATIDSYEVTAYDADGTLRGIATTAALTVNVTGLTTPTVTTLNPDTKYTVKVRAHNSVGWGSYSDGFDVNTRPPQPVVNNVTAGNGKALINYTISGNGDVPLATSNAGPGLGAIRVNAKCAPAPPNTLVCVDRTYIIDHPDPVNPNGTFTLDTGSDTSGAQTLANSRYYSFTIDLKNVDGNYGPPSATTANTTVTSIGAPDVPSRVSIQPWALPKIVLFRIPPVINQTGTAANNFNDKVTGFKIKDSRGGITPLIPVDPGNPNNTLQVGWLSSDGPQSQIDSGNFVVVPGTTFVDFREYTFQLASCNAFGCSAYSPYNWRGASGVPAVVHKIPSINNNQPLSVTTAYSVEPGYGSLAFTRFATTCYGQTGAAAARVLPGFPVTNLSGYAGTNPSADGTIVGTSYQGVASPVTGVAGSLLRGDKAWCTTSASNRINGVSFDANINCTAKAPDVTPTGCTYNDSFDPGGGTSETSGTVNYVYTAPTPPQTVTYTVSGTTNNKTVTFTFVKGNGAGSGFDPGGPDPNEPVRWRINGCFTQPDTTTGVTTWQITGLASNLSQTCNVYTGTDFGPWGTVARSITVNTGP